MPSLLRCLRCWHTIRETLGCQLRFEVAPDPRVFQIKVNERAALSNTDRRTLPRHDAPEAKRVLTTAGAQCQLTDWLLVLASGTKMLVEPTRAGTHDRSFLPGSADNFVLLTLFVRTDASFPWPHQGVAASAYDIENGAAPMSVRFIVLSRRPFREMALQRIANQAVTDKLKPAALPSSSGQGDVIGVRD